MTFEVLPVPLPGPGICQLCHGDSKTYRYCRSCAEILNALELGTTYPVPMVLPMGLALKTESMANTLWRYKRAASKSERATASSDLQFVIDQRLPHIVSHAAWDLATHIPGRQSRTSNVKNLLGGTDFGSGLELGDLLIIVEHDADVHQPDPERFTCPMLSGEHVLVLDDTFTRGATSLSAARALFEAGASEVTIVVIGRFGDRGWLPDDYMDEVQQREDGDEFCPACHVTLDEALSRMAGPPGGSWEAEDGSSASSGRLGDDPWPEYDSAFQRETLEMEESATDGERAPAPTHLQPTPEPPDEPARLPKRLPDGVSWGLTVVLFAPIYVAIFGPVVLSGLLDSTGGPWGVVVDRTGGGVFGLGGFAVYATFAIVSFLAIGTRHLLANSHIVLALAAFTVIFAGVIVVGVLAAQSSSASKGPGATGRQYLQALSDRDCDRLIDVADVEALSGGDADEATVLKTCEESMAEDDSPSLERLDETGSDVDKDNASVTYDLRFANGAGSATVTVGLERASPAGPWKVVSID